MADMVGWKTGYEIELLAPAGSSRLTLAEAVATRHGGAVRRVFHPQAEPSLVPGAPIFESLTLGFEVADSAGRPIARFVDDLTLRDDLDREAQAVPGWYRIAGDDVRLMRMIALNCDPASGIQDVLRPMARLCGGQIATMAGHLVRLSDSEGAPVAIAAPLVGQRERACEIVTAPLGAGHATALEGLLGPARELGFTAPVEGAVHLHFDASALCSARVIQRVMRLFGGLSGELKALCRTNPRCRHLSAWTEALRGAAESEDFAALAWPDAAARLWAARPVKYCDFNLLNVLAGDPRKHTFEVRILPVSLDAQEIENWAALFAALLRLACSTGSIEGGLAAVIRRLSLDEACRRRFLHQAMSLAA